MRRLAAGIDEATPQMPKRLAAFTRQSDARSYCRVKADPFSACGVARKARLPPLYNSLKFGKEAGNAL